MVLVLVLGAMFLFASAFSGTSMAQVPTAVEPAPAPSQAAVTPAVKTASPAKAAPVAAAVQTPEHCVPVTKDAAGMRLMSVGCGRPVVFYLPDFVLTAADRSAPNLEAVFQGLVDSGSAVIATDVGANSWGSPAAVEGLHNLINQYSPNSPPRILAMSMGNTVLLNYGVKYPIRSAAALIPVTSWTLEILLRSGNQPLLPQAVSYPYTVWQGAQDGIVGPVHIVGAVVNTLPGGHEVNLAWPVADIVSALLQALIQA
ncbi:MAG: hypothetical protein WD627_12510 [Actinomycetota bacterium]